MWGFSNLYLTFAWNLSFFFEASFWKSWRNRQEYYITLRKNDSASKRSALVEIRSEGNTLVKIFFWCGFLTGFGGLSKNLRFCCCDWNRKITFQKFFLPFFSERWREWLRLMGHSLWLLNDVTENVCRRVYQTI